MHTNPAFRKTPEDKNIVFARERGFGILSISAESGPLLSHVPFVISDDATHIDLHLTRSNPIARGLKTPQQAVIAVSGPDAYISPDWYDQHDQVPTWNYVAIHFRGLLSLRPQEALQSHLEEISAEFENRLLPKSPWRLEKLGEEGLQRQMRMILPVRLEIETVEGTWKLNQNKEGDAAFNAAKQVEESDFGQEVKKLANLMRDENGV